MYKLIKNVLKKIKRDIYLAGKSDRLVSINYTINLLRYACEVSNKDELNQLKKLQKQLMEKLEILEGIKVYEPV